jgi:hypothetical protein
LRAKRRQSRNAHTYLRSRLFAADVLQRSCKSRRRAQRAGRRKMVGGYRQTCVTVTTTQRHHWWAFLIYFYIFIACVSCKGRFVRLVKKKYTRRHIVFLIRIPFKGLIVTLTSHCGTTGTRQELEMSFKSYVYVFFLGGVVLPTAVIGLTLCKS